MAVIVEDGSGVPGANSYATEEQLDAWASARGYTLTGDPSVLLVRAFDYIEAREPRYLGYRTYVATSWPRTGVMLYSVPVASGAIPAQLIEAQCAMAVAADGNALQSSAVTVGPIASKSVGDVSVSYDTSKASATAYFQQGESALRSLYRQAFGQAWVTRA